MTAHEIEFIKPADSRDDLRGEITHYLDHGALRPGVTVAHLRTLASWASGRPGPRTIREFNLNRDAWPDWWDAINKIEARLARGAQADPGAKPEGREPESAADNWATRVRGE